MNAVCYTALVRYYIQFTAGIGDLVYQTLTGELSGMRVEYSDDSAMIFEAADPPQRIAVLPYVKNAFLIVVSVGRGGLDASIVQLGRCQEYWVVGRTGLDKLLLCMRLPRPRREEKARGAISRELSAVMVAASGPDPRDVFLDPFGGSGSFAVARLEHPVRKVWYSDIRLAEHRPAFDARLVRDDRVRLLDEDALRLPSISDGSVDVIVTDPPWGEHEALNRPYREFAAGIAASFARVLRPGRGRYVILINRDNAAVLRQALSASGIAPDDAHEVLVNGHPATVLVRGRAYDRADPVKTGQAALKPGHASRRTSARTAR